MKQYTRSTLLFLCLGVMAGCTHYQRAPEVTRELPSVSVPSDPSLPPSGVATYAWEEPMIDVVDVPPGLDPEGHYYRPGHQEIVEIRQGRWQHVEGPK